MQHAADRLKTSSSPARYCTACGKRIDPEWEFCENCGAPVRRHTQETQGTAQANTPPGTHVESDAARREASGDEDIIYLPGMTAETAIVTNRARKRRRRRRPLWRRPLVAVPLALLVIFASLAGAAVYRTSGVMSTLQTISTPPPEITDATYMEDGDPDMPEGPITVNTGPARAVIEEESADRSLPQPEDSGFGARFQDVTSSVGDIANAASVATGLIGGTDNGFTVLVMGVDAAPGAPIDIGVRPDVLMLVRFDPDTRSCRMLAIPRDTRVELPGYGDSKINHALMVGGIPYQLIVTEDFIGQEIDHYVLVDFVAFKEAVNAVGGIQVVIEEDLVENGEIQYTAGPHMFNGEEALAYARFRSPSDDGDIGRVERRWSILGGLADAAQGRDLVTDVNTLVPTVEEHIRTDLTLTEMAIIAKDYGGQCLNIDRDQIAMTDGNRVRFNDPILGQRLYYNVVSESEVQEKVKELIHGPMGSSPLQATPVATPQASPSPQGSATPAARRSSRNVGSRFGFERI